MNVPMEWSTRGLCSRDASQAFQLAVDLMERLDRRAPRAVACRVAVARDYYGATNDRHEIEGPVHVRVELTVSSRPSVVAVRHSDEGFPGEGVVAALHEAFRRVHAQLDEQRHEPRRPGSERRPLWLTR